jgi:hypothetical protein
MHRRILIVASTLTLLGLSTAAVSSRSERPSRAPCVEASEWVASHTAETPRDLAQFALYPKLYQKAIYRALSHDQRLHLWREHLALYSGSGSRLNHGQRKFIDSVSFVLSSLLNEKADSPVIGRFALQAENVLGVYTAHAVFGGIDPVDSLLASKEQVTSLRHAERSFARLRVESRIRTPISFASYAAHTYLPKAVVPSAVFREAMKFENCSCHAGSNGDFCDGGTGPHTQCSAVVGCGGIGCGWLWLQECNGSCQAGLT